MHIFLNKKNVFLRKSFLFAEYLPQDFKNFNNKTSVKSCFSALYQFIKIYENKGQHTHRN